jgi:hypothetical protein
MWIQRDSLRALLIWSNLTGSIPTRLYSRISGAYTPAAMLTSILVNKIGQRTWYETGSQGLLFSVTQVVSRLLKVCGKAIGRPTQVVLELKRNEV